MYKMVLAMHKVCFSGETDESVSARLNCPVANSGCRLLNDDVLVACDGIAQGRSLKAVEENGVLVTTNIDTKRLKYIVVENARWTIQRPQSPEKFTPQNTT